MRNKRNSLINSLKDSGVAKESRNSDRKASSVESGLNQVKLPLLEIRKVMKKIGSIERGKK